MTDTYVLIAVAFIVAAISVVVVIDCEIERRFNARLKR